MREMRAQIKKVDESRKLVLKPSGCAVAWAQMRGNDRLRWSEPCQHYVYNQSILTGEELLSLIWFQEGIRPAQVFIRKDGKVLSRQCTACNRSIKLMFASAAVLAGLVMLPLCLLSGARTEAPVAPAAPPSQSSVAARHDIQPRAAGSDTKNSIVAAMSTGRCAAPGQQGFSVVTTGIPISANQAGINPASFQPGATAQVTPPAVLQHLSEVCAQAAPPAAQAQAAPVLAAAPVQAAQQAPLALSSNQPGSQTDCQPGSGVAAPPVANDAPSQAPAPSYVWDARFSGRKTQ